MRIARRAVPARVAVGQARDFWRVLPRWLGRLVAAIAGGIGIQLSGAQNREALSFLRANVVGSNRDTAYLKYTKYMFGIQLKRGVIVFADEGRVVWG